MRHTEPNLDAEMLKNYDKNGMERIAYTMKYTIESCSKTSSSPIPYMWVENIPNDLLSLYHDVQPRCIKMSQKRGIASIQNANSRP